MRKIRKLFVTIIAIMAFAVNCYAFELQPVYQNELGQRVIEVTNNGASALRVLAKGGNVYNQTYSQLVTSNCKGPDYVIVASSGGQLVIMWVDNAGYLWRTPANYYQPVQKGVYTGGPMNTITGTGNSTQQYQQNQSQWTYQYPYQQNQWNYQNPYQQNQYPQYDDDYSSNSSKKYDISVTKNGNSYKYKDGSKTYEYTLKSDKLKYNSYEICDDVDAIGFIEDYIIYITDDNEAFAVEIGDKDDGVRILDDVEKMTYESGSNLINYIKADGEKYDADDIEDLIDDADDDDDDDDDDDYPYVRKSSEKYTYYKTSSKKYVYEFDDDVVEYKNEILDNVDSIAFTESGYLYMLTNDGELYQIKVGSTGSAKKVDSDISSLRISAYMATKAVDDDGNDINLKREYE